MSVLLWLVHLQAQSVAHGRNVIKRLIESGARSLRARLGDARRETHLAMQAGDGAQQQAAFPDRSRPYARGGGKLHTRRDGQEGLRLL
jgi:hypothetical protein